MTMSDETIERVADAVASNVKELLDFAQACGRLKAAAANGLGVGLTEDEVRGLLWGLNVLKGDEK